jgi:DNA-binding IclR family transcriptional regulator
MTDKSISTLADLEVELDRIRAAGYATNLAESEAEVRAVGVAILGLSGEPLGGISASAPASRFDPERILSIAEALQRSAARVGPYGHGS